MVVKRGILLALLFPLTKRKRKWWWWWWWWNPWYL